MSISPIGQRVGSWLAPEGRLSRMLLTILQHFESSALFVVCLMPALAFHALVGWQPTHLAVWLGVASLVPAGPGLFALLAVSRDFLAENGYPGHGIRRFSAAFVRGLDRLATWWALTAFLGLLLAYNLAIAGASDAVLVGSIVLLACICATTVGASVAVLTGADAGLLSLLAAVATVAIRRPHVVLTWILIGVTTGLACLLPVIGTSLALVLPGLAATAVLVVNAMTGYDDVASRRAAHADAR